MITALPLLLDRLSMGSRFSRTVARKSGTLIHPARPNRIYLSSKTQTEATDVHESQQIQMSVNEFCQWILSNIYRRQTAIRRVDLVKSTQARHAFHESLMFHVWGPLGGGGKYKDTPLNDDEGILFYSWRIIMERAGTVPQAKQVCCSLLPSLYFDLFFFMAARLFANVRYRGDEI